MVGAWRSRFLSALQTVRFDLHPECNHIDKCSGDDPVYARSVFILETLTFYAIEVMEFFTGYVVDDSHFPRDLMSKLRSLHQAPHLTGLV